MRGTPINYFSALNRHFNVLGVERQLFFLFVGITLPIAFSARLAISMDLFALILFFILYNVGVIVTRIDNQILAIYRRHISYKKYYAASSFVNAPIPFIKSSVPIYQGKNGVL